MSVLNVYIGQCGVQLGNEWEKHKIGQCSSNDPSHNIIKHSNPSLFIDSANNSMNDDFNFIQCSPHGMGNCFAMGYSSFSEGSSIREDTVNMMRKISEKHDRFSGIVFTHSSSGGTGSGLGCHLIEECRSSFGECISLVSNLVLPSSAGDTGTNIYNSTLSIAWASEWCDAVHLLDNDRIISALKKKNSVSKKNGELNFQNLNQSIIQGIVPIFSLPSNQKLIRYNNIRPIHDLVRSLIPIPSLPLVSSLSISSTESWREVGKELCGLISTFQPNKTVSSELHIRNLDDRVSNIEQSLEYERILKATKIDQIWDVDGGIKCFSSGLTSSRRKDLSSSVLTATSVLNCGKNGLIVDKVANQCEDLLHSNAYLQWFERHGFGKEIIHMAMENLFALSGNYKELIGDI